MTKQKKVAECIFKKGFVTETVDPLVDELWKASIGGKTPFGDLRNMFRRQHCRTLNPYGDSENCPYDEKDCARAFYAAVRTVTRAVDRVGHLDKPVGYFIRVAKSDAARRADEAVGLRARRAMMRSTHVLPDPPPSPPQSHPQDRGLGEAARGGDGSGFGGGEADTGGPGLPSPEARPDNAGPSVPSVGHGPVSLGDLFRSMELGPREGRPEDRGEGTGR